MRRYEENNLKVGRKKTNVMFIGDGKGKTVITGKKNVIDGMTTFHTASFGIPLSSLLVDYFNACCFQLYKFFLSFCTVRKVWVEKLEPLTFMIIEHYKLARGPCRPTC
ncbi:hypothetical protein V8G54_037591 [Vigna mungo]|uniref:Pectinesterase catalytic domain-containing protein n=1 Tax=Vigna mungo TaxID=3915 RepID=A0AAQ3MJ54_VIGMU